MSDIFISGLIPIGESVQINLLAPRKKITVMLMGNHSAGKSSFVNWYDYYVAFLAQKIM